MPNGSAALRVLRLAPILPIAISFAFLVQRSSTGESDALRDMKAVIGRLAADAAPSMRDYEGAYRWDDDGSFIYLQLWKELTGESQLTAFDESGELRALYPMHDDSFFVGVAAATPKPIEARIAFHRDRGRLVSLTWQPETAAPRTARRVAADTSEDIHFSNGNVQLAGTMISPRGSGRHPAIILVHGSGAEGRDYMLPFARFLVRHGVVVFGYDKRGVGASTGDWRTASLDDLAGDVVAAIRVLRMRPDIDTSAIGLLGWSQGGWLLPLAAAREPIAFLVSISGAGVPVDETTIDQARSRMTAGGMKTSTIEEILNLMKLQYAFARTGRGWATYTAARSGIATRLGRPPDTFPATPDDPYWSAIRRMYLYDPQPDLRRVRVPTLAFFGELDDNILAEKNRAAWDAALRAAGNSDYTLVVVPKANHVLLESKSANPADMASARRFAPTYAATLEQWLSKHVKAFR